MHLLVVEDDPRLGRLLIRLFREDRHVVELAETGQDGLDVADSGATLDAIVLDIGLPDVDGLEVARRLRARGSTTPIIMLTARDALNDRVAGLDAGADDYLTKPFAYEELAARLRALGRRANGDRPNERRAPDQRSDRPRRDAPARHRRGPPGRSHPARVRAPRVPAPSPGPCPLARPADRPGVAARRGRDPEHGRRVRHVPPAQARAGRAARIETVRGIGYRLARMTAAAGRAHGDGSAEPATDAALVRRVRRRLLLWSGGSTLVVLVVLGVLLYAAVANSLAAAATSSSASGAQMIAAADGQGGDAHVPDRRSGSPGPRATRAS